MTGALDGIKVLDLSQGAAGPTCAMALGDMGADVVKVEPPGGEWGRMLGPPFVGGVAAAFLGMNRNKRSIVVDLKEPDGRGVIWRIAQSSDVAIESFRPGVAERLGVGYDALSTVNPRIVYASISAFGQEGPWRDRPGVDGVAQAMGGIMSVTGSEEGPPVKVGVPAADMAGGMYTVQAVLAALFSRERTGRGQRVDVSLLDSLLAYQVVPLSMFLASGQAPRRLGTAAPYSAPNEAFPTNDGHVMVAAYTEKRWPALCRVLGCPDLAADPRFDTNEKRVRGRSELRGVLEPLFRARSTGDWLTLLDAADIICGPLLSYADLVREEHVIQSGTLATVCHPSVGDIQAPVFPGRFSESPIKLTGPPPARPGEHSREILDECGFDDLEIRKLLGSGVVADSGEAMTPAGRGGSR